MRKNVACVIRKVLLISLILTVVAASAPAAFADKWDFWRHPRRGANGQNSHPRAAWFAQAAAANIEFVRLIPDAWPAAERDFLLGDADHFKRIPEKDLATVVAMLDAAEVNGVKVVLTMFSLPGCRWTQLNNDQDDGRLWRDEAYQTQAVAFWSELARKLEGHPALVAYNPLNEPHPDREYGFEELGPEFDAWLKEHRGTVADLDRFNRRVVEAIRSVDPEIPILLDGWFYASPQAFEYNQPVDDPRVLYAFHNPGPWQMTAFRINKGRYSYPDRVPTEWNGEGQRWSPQRLHEELSEVDQWAADHAIERQRIVASEFWCDRRVKGADLYMAHLLNLYTARGWHWAFYAFRGDGDWTGLDFEVYSDELGAAYRQAVGRGVDPEPFKPRGDNPIWDVLRSALSGE